MESYETGCTQPSLFISTFAKKAAKIPCHANFAWAVQKYDFFAYSNFANVCSRVETSRAF